MTFRGWGWWWVPILGIPLSLAFRSSEDLRLSPPRAQPVSERSLSLPGGSRLRFLQGPDMPVLLSETEVPLSVYRHFQSEPPRHADAIAFCRWLSEQTGTHLRLPTQVEWQQAARAGIDGLPTPWGFEPDTPPSGVHFHRATAPTRPGKRFGYGFRDLAGGLWEWTQEGVAMGSAWSETDPETLRIDHAWTPPPDYRGSDLGIRLVWIPE